jgi:NTE family protein
MTQKRIAIACQGGGSQCAFIAGALKTLFSEGVQYRYEIVALSGTSGGAITAALAWNGLVRHAQGDRTPVEDKIMACWRDLTAQSPIEILIDGMCVQMQRLVEQGFLPSLASSPSSLSFGLWSRAVSQLIARPEFTDLRALLTKHLDFEEVSPAVEARSPVLLVGACDVMAGSFRVFSSARSEVNIDAVLASAAIPTLFPAVWVDGHPYWDGIFSSNPPVLDFIRKGVMREHPIPDEIWIIQVNRIQNAFVPERPNDIFDRRNHLAGNLSLHHELQLLEIVNLLLAEHALTDEFRERFGLDATEQIAVRFIRMSEGLSANLDYPSKLSRQPTHIARLIAEGESQASAFLAGLEEGRPPTRAPEAVVAETH